MAKGKGVKAAPPARAAAKGAAPAKGEPDVCLVVVMSRKDAPHAKPNLNRNLALQENVPQANPTLVNPIRLFSNHHIIISILLCGHICILTRFCKC